VATQTEEIRDTGRAVALGFLDHDCVVRGHPRGRKPAGWMSGFEEFEAPFDPFESFAESIETGRLLGEINVHLGDVDFETTEASLDFPDVLADVPLTVQDFLHHLDQ
jgi:hypothetical protein